MTLIEQRHKFACKLAEAIYSKYMVDAYGLNACNVLYNKEKAEQLKLQIDFSANGLSCEKLNPDKKSAVIKLIADPMMPIVCEDSLDTSQECNYLHIQEFESTLWLVIHSLGYHPNVTAVLINIDGTETEVHGLVTYLDENRLKIEFNEPTAGKAYLS